MCTSCATHYLLWYLKIVTRMNCKRIACKLVTQHVSYVHESCYSCKIWLELLRGSHWEILFKTWVFLHLLNLGFSNHRFTSFFSHPSFRFRKILCSLSGISGFCVNPGVMPQSTDSAETIEQCFKVVILKNANNADNLDTTNIHWCSQGQNLKAKDSTLKAKAWTFEAKAIDSNA